MIAAVCLAESYTMCVWAVRVVQCGLRSRSGAAVNIKVLEVGAICSGEKVARSEDREGRCRVNEVLHVVDRRVGIEHYVVPK